MPRPNLVVDEPFERMVRFFGADRSSASPHSYDAYVAAGLSPPHRIVEADILAINATMSARSPHADWQELIAHRDLSELRAIDSTWDLFLTPEKVWAKQSVPEKVAALFNVVIGKGIAISRATKVLHIKRPHLIPVCDSYVLYLMGIPGEDAASGVALIQHLRSLAQDLLPALHDLQRQLRERGCDRTLVRIMDGLIWSSHPDTWLSRQATDANSRATATASNDSFSPGGL